jgi:hypothetical protein
VPAETRSRPGRLTISPRWASVAIREVGPGMYGWIRIITATAITATLGAMPLALMSANSASAQSSGVTGSRSGTTEFSSQTRPRTVRPRTRIRVAPIYPYRTFSTDYPVPYEYEYPGPRGVRQCSSKLVQENRPSGQVIVPRMRCWWEVR